MAVPTTGAAVIGKVDRAGVQDRDSTKFDGQARREKAMTMTHSRREFLSRTGAVALLGATGGWKSPARAADHETVVLHARPGTVRLAPPGYPETPIWGYEGSVPGPTIRVPHGQRVIRRFLNGLPQPSTVHWHGVRIENAMDGAPELTQLPSARRRVPLRLRAARCRDLVVSLASSDLGADGAGALRRTDRRGAHRTRGRPGRGASARRLASHQRRRSPRQLRRPARLGPRGPHGQLDHGQRRRRVAPGVVAARAVCGFASSTPRMRGSSCWSFSAWKAGWWRWTDNRSRRRRRPDRWCSRRASGPT